MNWFFKRQIRRVLYPDNIDKWLVLSDWIRHMQTLSVLSECVLVLGIHVSPLENSMNSFHCLQFSDLKSIDVGSFSLSRSHSHSLICWFSSKISRIVFHSQRSFLFVPQKMSQQIKTKNDIDIFLFLLTNRHLTTMVEPVSNRLSCWLLLIHWDFFILRINLSNEIYYDSKE